MTATDPEDLRQLVLDAFRTGSEAPASLLHLQHLPVTPSEGIKSSNFNTVAPATPVTPKNCTEGESDLLEHLGPEEWRAALATLSQDRAPCPGFVDWPTIYANAWRFMDAFADRAAECGWSTLELWGVHPVVGATRMDTRGAALLSRRITGVSADRIEFGHLALARHPALPPTVAIWDYRWPAPKGVAT